MVGPDFGAELRRLRGERGLSLRELAARVHHGKSYLHELETGQKSPPAAVVRRLDEALDARGRLTATVATDPIAGSANDDAELDAVELARRVAASDVSGDTLERLERAVDEIAIAYPSSSPADLLPRVRRHLRYVGRLVDARKTLDQHRNLLVIGGWLSLLSATLHIDLRQPVAADAHLVTAGRLAGHTGHTEITAWCLETRAWDALTAGDFRRAVELSHQAQAIAPRGGSAVIQATAQEGRAWARLGDRVRTREALDRVERLVAPLPVPDRPEHHYRYDPQKALAYVATTLAWAGDPAAEQYARDVVAELDAGDGAVGRPRRAASARLDLALALLAADQPDEAAAVTITAIESGRVVPSNWWRATEVVNSVGRTGIAEAADLQDVYEAYRPGPSPP
ncbi:MAG TPA: helix-turn-helix domain-containing protein [Catenuloplanes sp.]|jgi:transcriptional regulator with XRE-family HTH domain